MTEQEILQVNESFNEQLQQQIAGTLPAGHVYHLGGPSDILILSGIPDNPIEMASTRLYQTRLHGEMVYTNKK